jgi:hypothetical protein
MFSSLLGSCSSEYSPVFLFWWHGIQTLGLTLAKAGALTAWAAWPALGFNLYNIVRAPLSSPKMYIPFFLPQVMLGFYLFLFSRRQRLVCWYFDSNEVMPLFWSFSPIWVGLLWCSFPNSLNWALVLPPSQGRTLLCTHYSSWVPHVLPGGVFIV